MFKPMSFNVIRQALTWHGIPLPIMRVTGTYKWPSGMTSGDYRLTWPGRVLRDKYGDGSLADGDYLYTLFMYAVRECFCDDITLTQLHYDRETDLMIGNLYVRVLPHPNQ